MTSPGLTPGSWVPLSGGSVSNDGNQRTVTYPGATATKKFSAVEIVKPGL